MPIAAMKSHRRVDSSRWFKQRTEVSASEPLVNCRNAIRRCRNWRATLSPGSAWGMPETARATSNMLGGAKLNQALVRNVRTYTAMLREKAQAAPIARPKVRIRMFTACVNVLWYAGCVDRIAIARPLPTDDLPHQCVGLVYPTFGGVPHYLAAGGFRDAQDSPCPEGR